MMKYTLGDTNSAYHCFENNIESAKYAVESVLNEYNQEVYISLSPGCKWNGCHYLNYGDADLLDIYGIIPNRATFGIFNSADASITMHCIYDSVNKEYDVEFIYYLVDFYDFSFYPLLQEEDALGLARSYELFGKCKGKMSWKKGEKGWVYFDETL